MTNKTIQSTRINPQNSMLNDKIKIKNIHFKKKNNKTRVNLAITYKTHDPDHKIMTTP
jgi:hypothetical protein